MPACPGSFRCLVGLATLFSVAYSARLAVRVFFGPQRHDYPAHPHDPPAGMWLPVAVLVVLVVAIGLLPALIAGPIVERTALAVIGASAAVLLLWRSGMASPRP